MSGHLLDTDTISLAQYGHATVVARLAAHPVADIYTCVVSYQEQMRGWLGRVNQLTTPARLADWYDRLVYRMMPVWSTYTMLSFPEPAILRFQHLRSLRLNIGLMDLRIAAIALENAMTVVTRNVRDFGRVPGISVEDWSI